MAASDSESVEAPGEKRERRGMNFDLRSERGELRRERLTVNSFVVSIKMASREDSRLDL